MADRLLSLVRAQDAAIRTLRHALANGRVHHAYLFAGPDGVGKELAAMGLAQALVCSAKGASAGGLFAGVTSSEVSSEACGACSACERAVPRGDGRLPSHPDITVLERGLYAPQTIGRRTPETQDLSIDQVRTLVLAHAAYPPHEGQAKVFIVRRVEEMSVSAANALLKTLEEPAAKTHFILLTSQPDALLPTLRSRTQRVRFAPLPLDVVESILVAQGLTPENAANIACLSGGSVEAASRLADPTESEARTHFVQRAIDALAAPGIEPLLALAEEAKKDKGELPRRIEALAVELALRAATAARAGEKDAVRYANRGRLALLALEHLDFNNAPQMVVESMLSRMRSC
jgi:DNA polymerase-3 subunit delta'